MCIRFFLLLWVCTVPLAVRAQQAPLRFGAVAVLDYGYRLASPDSAREGEGAFVLRRINATADVRLSERFSGQLRLEANEQSLPDLFVHSAWLRWHDVFGARQDLIFGLLPNPFVKRGEASWGYRNLERVLTDRVGVVDSRDLGVAFQGQASILTYTLGFVNAERPGPEANAPGREVYAVLEATPAPFSLAVGTDFRWEEGAPFRTVTALAGWQRDRNRLGAEAFVEDGDETRAGASIFSTLGIGTRWTLIGRLDGVQREEQTDYFAIGGIGYRAAREVELIPNVVVAWREGRKADVLARGTLAVRF